MKEEKKRIHDTKSSMTQNAKHQKYKKKVENEYFTYFCILFLSFLKMPKQEQEEIILFLVNNCEAD